ncbi:MAG: GNAT family N-acetyltransferase [Deltaproteobacteria bacterium]|nr:GNAT family N-acetyltransferase [Deltaproteobacteria bacterium]
MRQRSQKIGGHDAPLCSRAYDSNQVRHGRRSGQSLADRIIVIRSDLDPSLSLIGYLIAGRCHQGKKADILRIAVHPNHRGKGIAKELLETSFRVFSEDNIEEVSLHVDSSNRAAVKLYEKLGFEIIKANPFLGDQDFNIFYVMQMKLPERKEKKIPLWRNPWPEEAGHAIH